MISVEVDAMTTMNISLPKELKSFVDRQLKSGGYSTASEYVRELIRDAQKQAEGRLEKLLLAGLNSGEPVEVTPDWWKRKRAALVRRHRKTRKP